MNKKIINKGKLLNKATKARYYEASNWDDCTHCGECLVRCNQLNVNHEEAKTLISDLIVGKYQPRYIYKHCTLCMSCNGFCPEGLKPFELILQRFAERRDGREKKLFSVLNYLLVGTPGSGFFHDMTLSLKRKEMEALKKWGKVPPPTKEVLFPGCFGKLFTTDINNSEVLKELAVYSPPNVCCGEWHYRTGLWEQYTEMAEKFVKNFSQLECERLICLCSSCYSFIGKILPEVYGKVTGRKTLPFKVISLIDWLWEKVERGELEVKNPLTYKGTIHDSCHSRRNNMEIGETLRKLYEYAGAEIVEMPFTKMNGKCCGAAAMAKSYKPQNLLNNYFGGMIKRFKEVEPSGTNHLILHCEGCILPMRVLSPLFRTKLHYHREELLRAFGDKITKPIVSVLPMLLRIIIRRVHIKVLKKIPINEFPHVV